jgi:DNA-binding GntR family transcriptional regulator
MWMTMEMRLKEVVARELRNAIIKGKHRPGERLVENDLCAHFRVSRTPIREALDQLDREGFLKITPGAGAKVVEFSQKDTLDLYDLLITLEGAAARLACPHISDEQIAKLEEYDFLFQEAAKGGDDELLFQLNHRFHWLITEATDNRHLIEMRLNFRQLIDKISRTFPWIPQQTNVTLEEHERIVDALKTRNPARAEFTMREHLEGAKHKLKEYLDREQRELPRRK